MRNKEPLEIGDLVECTMIGSPHFGKSGIVTDRIHYVYDEGFHPDEYSCSVMLTGNLQNVMFRAKWLKVMSKVRKDETQN